MKKILLTTIIVVVAASALALTGCSGGGGTLTGLPEDIRLSLNSQQEGIWVSGQGKVTAAPDIAMLRLGVEAQGVSVATAQTDAANAMDGIMEALRGNGIAEKDIQTTYFNIYKVTRWDRDSEKEVVIGFRVTNSVSVKIREIEKAGAIIDKVAVAGGDLTRVDGISFTVENPEEFQTEARELAMADAKAKAEQMASLAGIKLGKPTYITESSYIPAPMARADFAEGVSAAMAKETSISPGEMQISLSVQVAYSILN